MRIALTCDHNGVALRDELTTWLTDAGHAVEDLSPRGLEPVDYPPLCADLCARVVAGEAAFGVVLGGSGQGEQIACNKIRGIRAALCHCHFTTEIARAHNDANVMVMGAKVVTSVLARELVHRWITTTFKGGAHQRRVDQIAALERCEPLSGRHR